MDPALYALAGPAFGLKVRRPALAIGPGATADGPDGGLKPALPSHRT